uniref:Uncharacterized protein n=1 Tax=Anguilla anguilla TaxID=7936 RepID=A0A0E9XRB9_ANGAN
MFASSSGAAQWPTIEDCGCTGHLPGVIVYECEAGCSCKRAFMLSEPTLGK